MDLIFLRLILLSNYFTYFLSVLFVCFFN